MARPHIDFVQTQRLPWQDGALINRPDLSLKLLSTDDETGAISAVVRYPAGWSASNEWWLNVDEELFVLEGDLTINGRRYSDHTYANLPAGYLRREAATSQGAVALTFFSGAPSVQSGKPSRNFPMDGLVEFIDLAENVWDGDMESMGLAPMRQGAQMRVLRKHPTTGEVTYVTATIAFRRGRQAERHPVSQEFYLLAGELAGDMGVMQAGAYCIRPPMAKHAPYGSKTGALIFFRSVGGPQTTQWEDTTPFTFTPNYNPILPPEMQKYALTAMPRWPRY